MAKPSNKKSSPKKPDSIVSTGSAADAALSETALKKVTGGAQVDYFLKIDGVDGESTDDKHKGEIQIG